MTGNQWRRLTPFTLAGPPKLLFYYQIPEAVNDECDEGVEDNVKCTTLLNKESQLLQVRFQKSHFTEEV